MLSFHGKQETKDFYLARVRAHAAAAAYAAAAAAAAAYAAYAADAAREKAYIAQSDKFLEFLKET